MCMFGASHQKCTTLSFSSGMAPFLRSLKRLRCSHTPGVYASLAGGSRVSDGTRSTLCRSCAIPARRQLLSRRCLLLIHHGSRPRLALRPPIAHDVVQQSPPAQMSDQEEQSEDVSLGDVEPPTPAPTPEPVETDSSAAEAEPTSSTAPPPLVPSAPNQSIVTRSRGQVKAASSNEFARDPPNQSRLCHAQQ